MRQPRFKKQGKTWNKEFLATGLLTCFAIIGTLIVPALTTTHITVPKQLLQTNAPCAAGGMLVNNDICQYITYEYVAYAGTGITITLPTDGGTGPTGGDIGGNTGCNDFQTTSTSTTGGVALRGNGDAGFNIGGGSNPCNSGGGCPEGLEPRPGNDGVCWIPPGSLCPDGSSGICACPSGWDIAPDRIGCVPHGTGSTGGGDPGACPPGQIRIATGQCMDDGSGTSTGGTTGSCIGGTVVAGVCIPGGTDTGGTTGTGTNNGCPAGTTLNQQGGSCTGQGVDVCPSGTTRGPNNQCTSSSGCPSGTHQIGGSNSHMCAPNSGTGTPICGTGYSMNSGGQCVPTTTGTTGNGTTGNGTTGTNNGCPAGTHQVGNTSVCAPNSGTGPIVCASGTHLVGSQCVPNTTTGGTTTGGTTGNGTSGTGPIIPICPASGSFMCSSGNAGGGLSGIGNCSSGFTLAGTCIGSGNNNGGSGLGGLNGGTIGGITCGSGGFTLYGTCNGSGNNNNGGSVWSGLGGTWGGGANGGGWQGLGTNGNNNNSGGLFQNTGGSQGAAGAGIGDN